MILFLYGEDYLRATEKLDALVNSLQKKKPGSLVLRFGTGDVTPEKLEELIGGQGLFEQKYIVVLHSACADEAGKGAVLAKAKELAESSHAFILYEPSLDAASRKKLEKYAEKSQVFEKSSSGKQAYNPFAMTDALGERNRKKLWVLYQEAMFLGSSPEEIHGILFWAVKGMLAARISKTPEEAGLKPYPFQKAKTFGRNYTDYELVGLSRDLVELFHRSRRGELELEIGLERFILGDELKN